jgi:hypothetical protein
MTHEQTNPTDAQLEWADRPEVLAAEAAALDHAVKVGLISAEKRARMDTPEYRSDPSTDADYEHEFRRATIAWLKAGGRKDAKP